MLIKKAKMLRKLHLGDVSLNLCDTWQRGHCLKVNCHNLDLFTLVFSSEIRQKMLKCNYNKKHYWTASVCVVYTLSCSTDQVHRAFNQPEFAAQNLAPAARCRTQIHSTTNTCMNVGHDQSVEHKSLLWCCLCRQFTSFRDISYDDSSTMPCRLKLLPLKRLNSSSSCRSLKALLALQPSSFASL